MNVIDKNLDLKDNIAIHLKRAPSVGTVITAVDNLNWERSQSDANLTIQKDNLKSDNSNVPHISENARVYWDLSCTDQGDNKVVSMSCNEPVSGVGGFHLALETIHQYEELFEMNSSKESLTSDAYTECSSSCQRLESLPKNHLHQRTNSYTSTTGISSLEHFPEYSLNKRILSEVEIRKSCSAIPTTFCRKSGGVADVGGDVEKVIQTTTTHKLENGLGGSSFGNKTDTSSIIRKSVPIEITTSNYFCESDFDDNKEQIPNYQVKLKSFYDEVLDLINQLEISNFSTFEWPDGVSIDFHIQILSKCTQILKQAWMMPNVGRDIATSLCDLIRQEGLLKYLTHCMSIAGQVVDNGKPNQETTEIVYRKKKYQFILTAAELFSQILTCDNIDSILGLSSRSSTPKGEKSHDCMDLEILTESIKLFREVVRQSWYVKTDEDMNRAFISILEGLLKHHEKTNRLIVQSGGLKTLIYSCRSTDNATLRHVAFSMVNLGLFGDFDIQMTMAHFKVADWLFPLAFNEDVIIKYYACLAIVVLSAHKELAQMVYSSGTLELVFSFLQNHSPYNFAEIEPSHLQGRSSKWLQRLLPILKSDSIEAVSLVSFHFVMEARIKHRQGKTKIFSDIGAIECLQKVASSTFRIAAQFARQALKILGESVPFSLSHPAPIWSVEDVCNWLRMIDFEDLCNVFQVLKIDGDILLTMTEEILENHIQIKNKITRLRLMREITKLKNITTYETCDPTGVYDWLKLHVGSDYCHYTYSFIKAGVDRKFLSNISDEMLVQDCSVRNSVHRSKILKAVDDCKVKFLKESKVAIISQPIDNTDYLKDLSRQFSNTSIQIENIVVSNHADDSMYNEPIIKNIDVFISYRRSTGSQLASLLMVHLRLRGYRVFLDIERLPAGKFNENLLQSIQRTKNFIIVLTPNSLDRCIGDGEKKDWVHREIVCALQSNCNIIPVTDKFEFPKEDVLPSDMRSLLHYNAVTWVHDYQEACIDKIEQFIKNQEFKCPFSPPQMRMPPVIKTSNASNFQDDIVPYL